MILKDKKQITLTTLYELKTIDNILNFIDSNIEFLLNCRENNKLTTTSFIYNYIHDLSGFDIDKINNEVIKNDPLIRKRVDSLLIKHNIVVKKINEQYIKDRISDLSVEETHKIIKTPEGYEMPLMNYLYDELLSRISSHTDVIINNQNTQLDVILKYCISQVKNKKSNEYTIQ